MTNELTEACRAMIVETGGEPCEIPWCHRAATHRWVRTAAEIKASRVKVKRCVQEMTAESTRCEVHVPDWRVDVYRSIRPAAAERVA